VAQAQEGDHVHVHYTGRLEDGTVFDESDEDAPLAFTLGENQVIPGFESAVMGMEPGDEKTAEIDPDAAYGDHREDMVMELDRAELPDNLEPQVGQQLKLRLQDGRTVPVLIREISDESVTIDANHPLAGRKLVFDIELVDIDSSNGEA
jgi:peptidylprolyl isomerase/FKBP-type peptidyl-prolyl cis-trans isomerase SlpA